MGNIAYVVAWRAAVGHSISIFWLYILRLCAAFEVFRIGAAMAQKNISGPVWMIPTFFAALVLAAIALGLWQHLKEDSWMPDFSAPAILSSYVIGALLAVFALVSALEPQGWISLVHILVMSALAYAAILHGYRSQKAFFGS